MMLCLKSANLEAESFNRRKLPSSLQFKKKPLVPRKVPAFTIQVMQSNVMISSPPRAISKPYPVGGTKFRKYQNNGLLPIANDFRSPGQRIIWTIKIEELAYENVLPIFFDGLCEVDYPYCHFVRVGLEELILKGSGKILSILPRLILPIKRALETKNWEVIASTLKILQNLAKSQGVGEALVPYYRIILPKLNAYKDMNFSSGDEVDFGQQRRKNIGDLVNETLEIFEVTGGPTAFINIKYMVPLYESCIFENMKAMNIIF